MCNIAETKKEMRKRLSLLRNELNSDYKEKSDSLIVNNVINSEAYFNSKIILAFYPIKSEPQISASEIARDEMVCFISSGREMRSCFIITSLFKTYFNKIIFCASGA